MSVSNGERSVVYAVLAVFLGVSSCVVSPVKTEKKDETPLILSIGMEENAVFHTRDVPVSWTANEYAERFRCTLDGVSHEWIDTTAVVLTDLDEGAHVLTVHAKKDTVMSEPVTVTFTVDALSGPGVILSPRKISGISFVTLRLEEVERLMAAHIEIYCEDDCAYVADFSPSGSVADRGGLIVLADTDTRRRLVMDVGFAGLAEGVSGNVEIGRFLVRPLKDEGVVRIDSLKTVFRDKNNEPIAVRGYDRVRIVR